MAHQGERVAHADVPHPARTDRGVDHRQPRRAAHVMERAPPDPGRPGGPQDVGCRLDRDAARSPPAAGRPRARRRRGLLVCRRARALRRARVVFLHAFRGALPARAHRDSGGSPRATLGGAAQRETSQWDRVADEHGFIVVYPSGEGGGGPRVWHEDGGAGPSRDIRFISELIDTLEARYNIDPKMIYANGLSNGGGMSFALSCTLSDRIAAVGMVGAALLVPFRWCTDQRPVPMIAFHGTADSAAPYQGGFSWVAPQRFQGVRAFTASWARRNRCDRNPVDSVVATDVTRREYPNCADDAAGVLYTIKGGGHTWPGGQPPPEWVGGPPSNSTHASSLMWAFFRAHRLREAQTGARHK